MTLYRAKPDTWFKEGTVAELVESIYTNDGKEFGIFRGTYIVGDTGYDKFWYNKGYKEGDEVVMNELCCFDEFNTEII
jgi:hypothetical protein